MTDPTGAGRRKSQEERRYRWDRREDDRRRGERRMADQRTGERRLEQRRSDTCPSCGEPLTAAYYCRKCKVRIIKIRPTSRRPAARR